YAVGATTITLASAGTGTILAGDVITFAGDTNQYNVVSGDADVSNGGTITLAAPGLRKAMSAATKAITVLATSPRNMAFSRSAIVLATRMPERPQEGDMAIDVMTIQDPRSGLAFEVAMYPGYRKVRYEIALAWGVKNIKPEHTATLLG
ncbi:MAG TPA: P22 coat - protein 5 family protein, partial [Agitococcus sp.]|nr:P22 coat - protein 5 family protein [Agitococcus sp.]